MKTGLKSIKTLVTATTMKKLAMKKVRKDLDYEYCDDIDDLICPLLSSCNYGKSADPAETSSSSSTRMNSGSNTIICDMCVKSIQLEASFDIKGCNHLYCRQCIMEFVVLKLSENVTVIMCPEPGCNAVLDPENFRQILPNYVYDRWMSALYDQTRQSSNSTSTNSVESSQPSASDPSSTFICDLCDKPTHLEHSFDVEGCNHFYCKQCIVDFVLSKLEDNVTSIVCPEPGCRGVLGPEYCRAILPNHVFDRWVDHASDSESFRSGYVTFPCELCAVALDLEDSFDVKGCTHFYCRQCIVTFVLNRLEHNVTAITCPEAGCRGVLDPEYCHSILPEAVFEWWENALHSQNHHQTCNPEIFEASTSNIDTSTFVCDICFDEPFPLEDSFNIKGCTHFYCQQCVAKHIASKLQDNVTSITCPEPGCIGVLDLEYCRPILPEDTYDRWGKALCENMIMGSENARNYFYCPFADCSALVIRDDDINQSQCPHCKREVCAKCKVPWHVKFNCDDFQRLSDMGEDEMVKELATRNKWRQCPQCKYYVEKDKGCSYIKCRCGYAFCYSCGEKAIKHYRLCIKCKQ